MNNFKILIGALVSHDDLALTLAEITQFRLRSLILLIRKNTRD